MGHPIVIMNESDFIVIKYKPEMFIGRQADFSGPRAGLLHLTRARGRAYYRPLLRF
jgi:hypothetical protein